MLKFTVGVNGIPFCMRLAGGGNDKGEKKPSKI